jgi:hypothetical protein
MKGELQYRRECILDTISSIPRHFLQLYTSRTRQCKLGYDSSSSCDSYQLGEMVKFLVNHGLLSLVDFSPTSLDAVQDCATVDIYQILSTLKQCPSYQIDKNHTNCGMRTRILPILDYIQTVLSSNAISIRKPDWKTNRDAVSWLPNGDDPDNSRSVPKVFRFTRSVASDQRLRYEGVLGADRMAKPLFAAEKWDWTPED